MTQSEIPPGTVAVICVELSTEKFDAGSLVGRLRRVRNRLMGHKHDQPAARRRWASARRQDAIPPAVLDGDRSFLRQLPQGRPPDFLRR